ncbi:MAG: DciA family protein [Telluria sp.]
MHIYGTKTWKTFEATDFLRKNERMASLMPAAMRMGSLQKDCADALPPMFSNCDVLSFEQGQLVLATPTSSVAAKLKQQLPKLQAALQKRGWQVDAIKLKVQVTRSAPPAVEIRKLSMPDTAVSAFEELGETLEATPQNEKLIAAIKSMAAKRRAY